MRRVGALLIGFLLSGSLVACGSGKKVNYEAWAAQVKREPIYTTQLTTFSATEAQQGSSGDQYITISRDYGDLQSNDLLHLWQAFKAEAQHDGFVAATTAKPDCRQRLDPEGVLEVCVRPLHSGVQTRIVEQFFLGACVDNKAEPDCRRNLKNHTSPMVGDPPFLPPLSP